MKTLSARGILFLVGRLPKLRFRHFMGETDEGGRLFLHIVPLPIL